MARRGDDDIADPAAASADPSLKEFLRELGKEIDDDYDDGKRNNITDVALALVGVVGSLAATVFAASATGDPRLVAFAAALPAAVTVARSLVNFSGRSRWYFKHAVKLKVVEQRGKYGHAPLSSLVEERTTIDLNMIDEWEKAVTHGEPMKEPAARR